MCAIFFDATRATPRRAGKKKTKKKQEESNVSRKRKRERETEREREERKKERVSERERGGEKRKKKENCRYVGRFTMPHFSFFLFLSFFAQRDFAVPLS